MSAIEWTEMTWNPTLGCSVASPGCRFCYAARMASRLARIGATARYAPTVQIVHDQPTWTGEIVSAPDATWELPLKRKKPSLIFVDSMSDLFHEHVPDTWVERAFGVMRAASWHRYQLLTKRTARMLAWTRKRGCPPNVWLGTSVEDQRRAELQVAALAMPNERSRTPWTAPGVIRVIERGFSRATPRTLPQETR